MSKLFQTRDVLDAMQEALREDITHKIVVVFCKPIKGTYIKVRVTRKRRQRTMSGNRVREDNLVVTIGHLNYLEREYHKLCRKAKTKPRRFWFPKR